MGFLSGAASFSRFEVVGGAPKRLDQAVIEKLSEHVIGSQREKRTDGIEVGWVGGSHVLDRTLDLGKNVLGDALHFGFRIDTAKVPPEIMRAYVRMELEALAKDNPTGRPSAKQRKLAKANAERRGETEIKQGRFHRMREFPILIDSRGDALLIATTVPAVIENLHPLFRATFGKRLEPLTSGRLAYRIAEKIGATRRVEQLSPAEFVRHPGGDAAPGVFWTLHDPESRDYLGNEFLLWLWWQQAEEGGTIELSDKSEAHVVLVRNLTLECPWGETGKETILAAGPGALPEARRAIQTGKLPRRAGLIINRQGSQYELTLQAETLAISAATLPKAEGGAADENGDGKSGGRGNDLIERVDELRNLCQTIDLLFEAFVRRRLTGNFEDRGKISRWMRDDARSESRVAVEV